MELFFLSFLDTAKVIKSFIKEKQNVKISVDESSLDFSVQKALSKEEKEKSAKAFFYFIKKNISHLDRETLPMKEQAALIEVVAVLELYLNFQFRSHSKFKESLQREIFSLKVGSLVPVSYIEKNSEAVRFIKNNGLEKIIFYHAICLSFDKKEGIGFPMQTSNCIKQVVFFNALKKYSLSGVDKYYYEGELLFSLDEGGKLVRPLKIKNGAFVNSYEFFATIVYSKGYLNSCFEVYHKDKDCFIAVHDGQGRVYRFGFENKKVVSPDKYLYEDISDFNRFTFDLSKESTNELIKELLREGIFSKEEMVERVLKILDMDELFVRPLTSKNKFLSFVFIPKLFVKVFSGEISIKSLLTPWKLKKLDFKKMEENRSLLSKKNFS